jgi:hypothetical protein
MDSYNLQKVACMVYAVLIDNLRARDSDIILLSEIWKKELAHFEDKNNFLDKFESNQLSNPESVCRVRRKLQEKHKNLRGDKWDTRHNFEGCVNSQLTFFDKWYI